MLRLTFGCGVCNAKSNIRESFEEVRPCISAGAESVPAATHERAMLDVVPLVDGHHDGTGSGRACPAGDGAVGSGAGDVSVMRVGERVALGGVVQVQFLVGERIRGLPVRIAVRRVAAAGQRGLHQAGRRVPRHHRRFHRLQPLPLLLQFVVLSLDGGHLQFQLGYRRHQLELLRLQRGPRQDFLKRRTGLRASERGGEKKTPVRTYPLQQILRAIQLLFLVVQTLLQVRYLLALGLDLLRQHRHLQLQTLLVVLQAVQSVLQVRPVLQNKEPRNIIVIRNFIRVHFFLLPRDDSTNSV